MNKQRIKRRLVSICPNVPFLRKILTKYEINKYTKMLMSDEEVEKAEIDETEKQRVLGKKCALWQNRVRTDNDRIDRMLQVAPDYKGISEEQRKVIRQDIHFCRYAYGFMPEEYLCYDFMNKTPKERKMFISESDHMRFCYQMNDPVDISIFNDKARTYERFGKYYHRQVMCVSKKSNYPDFLKFVEAHPIFVKKQVYESCGNSIEKIDARSCGKSERELFESFLKQGKVVLEELVEQGAATACFNASSVNTIRCITVNTKKGVLTPYCFMKIGRKGAFVDNGGAGGILVGIDEKTGMTNTVGYDELRRIYERHPDSGVAFVGHQLPEWDRMIAICKEMASQIPTVRFIGWDLAYTDDKGWVVIEGNGMSQFIGPQTIWQRGIKEEVMQFMKDMDL